MSPVKVNSIAGWLLIVATVAAVFASVLVLADGPVEHNSNMARLLAQTMGVELEADHQRPSPGSSSAGCQKCLRAIEMVKNEQSYKKIEVTLWGLCILTHNPWSIFACRVVVKEIIIELKIATPEKICEDLQMCPRHQPLLGLVQNHETSNYM